MKVGKFQFEIIKSRGELAPALNLRLQVPCCCRTIHCLVVMLSRFPDSRRTSFTRHFISSLDQSRSWNAGHEARRGIKN